MFFKKNLISKTVIILILNIIHFTVATDCDILNKSFSYINDNIIKNSNCCNEISIVKCNDLNQITSM